MIKKSAPKKAVKKPASEPRPRRTDPNRKISWPPGTVLWPVPVVMVSCAGKDGKPNIITIAWTGTVCSEPPMLSISVRPPRHSHKLIMESGEFVVNVPTAEQIKTLDTCGVVSGRDVDKFKAYRLTAGPALKVKAPIIQECPLNIECLVRKRLELGTHTMFIAEIVAVQVSERLMAPSGRMQVEKAGLVAFAHNEYYALGRKLGHFGFSVRKRGGTKRKG